MLSVIIPSYKDPFLHKTIDDIIENFTGDYEIIPVIDGYELEQPIRQHPRVRPLTLPKNKGMREAINAGIQEARGEYLMRTDEHCCFAPGFDTTILETIEDNWIVVPRRYFLDPNKWEVIAEKRYIDYEKLIIKKEPLKFASLRWRKRSNQRKHILVDETMAFQGSCWVMAKSWWKSVIKRLDSEGYGILYQDTVEMQFKTWQAGGKLMLNKATWYAHKHRKFNRTHNYPNRLARKSFQHALNTWGDYYERVILPEWGLESWMA